MYDILRTTNGQREFRHANGEISKVRIEEAGLGIRRVRLTNIPPEIPDRTIKVGLNRYGEVKEVKEEKWSRAYRYPVASGIRIATIRLSQHIASHILIAGYRTLIPYEGQPSTCYGCNETGHVYQECPRRRRTRVGTTTNNTTSWAKVAATGSRTTTAVVEDMEERVGTEESAKAVATQRVLEDSETQRMEQDPTMVGNTLKAEDHKVEESTRETNQKRKQENQSDEPDVEVTTDQAVQLTTNSEESYARQKSKGRMMDMDDTQKKSKTEEDYVSDMQGRGLEQTESRFHQSENEASPTVQAPRPKRPKKLKVERQGEKLQEGQISRTRASSLKT
jgi:hypothetical protein